jgi:hypothetical protein
LKTQRIACLGLVLLFFLLLPLILAVLDQPHYSEKFKSLPSSDLGHPSPYSFIAEEISNSAKPIDILILGSSFGWTGLDATEIKSELSKEISREAIVLNFGTNWRGEEQYYIILRDLLLKRKIQMVLWTQPVWEYQQQQTWHFRSNYFMRFGDRTLIEGLPLYDKITWYGHLVLGSPRQLLSAFRPNLTHYPINHSDSFGSYLKMSGFNGKPFQAQEIRPLNLNPDDLFASTNNLGQFQKDCSPFPEFQTFWLNKFGELVDKESIFITAISIPVWKYRKECFVKQSLLALAPLKADLLGIPPAKLFGNMPDLEQETYFYNEHLNLNGSKYFTCSILPGIIAAYKKSLVHNDSTNNSIHHKDRK